VKPPDDLSLPFFAYGIFRPGQLAYFRVRDFVERVDVPAIVHGSLLIRDGLPIIDRESPGEVVGALIKFAERHAVDGYAQISALEPAKQYWWCESKVTADTGTSGGVVANVLMGRSPDKGSIPWEGHEGEEWDGWTDPLFTTALDVVEETLAEADFDWDLRPLFRLQMAYLLLWSSIERYASLRYYLGRGDVWQKVKQVASEPAFGLSLQQHVAERREVRRADEPSDKATLDESRPSKAVDYYYQMRSNITHRGKGAPNDYDNLAKSIEELLAIFRDVLEAARHDSEDHPEETY
jgi:hypothetical protein